MQYLFEFRHIIKQIHVGLCSQCPCDLFWCFYSRKKNYTWAEITICKHNDDRKRQKRFLRYYFNEQSTQIDEACKLQFHDFHPHMTSNRRLITWHCHKQVNDSLQLPSSSSSTPDDFCSIAYHTIPYIIQMFAQMGTDSAIDVSARKNWFWRTFDLAIDEYLEKRANLFYSRSLPHCVVIP